MEKLFENDEELTKVIRYLALLPRMDANRNRFSNQYVQQQLKTFTTMILRGFIKELGETRSWTNREGATMTSVKLTLQVPYVSRDGQERYDELQGEISYGNPQFLDGLRQAQQAREKCEMQVGFSLSEWQGRQIQNIRVYNVTKLLN